MAFEIPIGTSQDALFQFLYGSMGAPGVARPVRLASTQPYESLAQLVRLLKIQHGNMTAEQCVDHAAQFAHGIVHPHSLLQTAEHLAQQYAKRTSMVYLTPGDLEGPSPDADPDDVSTAILVRPGVDIRYSDMKQGVQATSQHIASNANLFAYSWLAAIPASDIMKALLASPQPILLPATAARLMSEYTGRDPSTSDVVDIQVTSWRRHAHPRVPEALVQLLQTRSEFDRSQMEPKVVGKSKVITLSFIQDVCKWVVVQRLQFPRLRCMTLTWTRCGTSWSSLVYHSPNPFPVLAWQPQNTRVQVDLAPKPVPSSTLDQKTRFDLGLCAYCGQRARDLCARCNQVYYCSKDHQTQHWKKGHQQSCRKSTS